jgi:ATP-dependent Lon protease
MTLQDVLEAFSLKKRMEKVLVLLKKELDVARLQSDIREKVDEKMTEQQREFFLRQQFKAIQKELGIAKDDKTAELDTLRERIAKLNAARSRQKSASTRRCTSCRCWRPARPNTPSPATIWTG